MVWTITPVTASPTNLTKLSPTSGENRLNISNLSRGHRIKNSELDRSDSAAASTAANRLSTSSEFANAVEMRTVVTTMDQDEYFTPRYT